MKKIVVGIIVGLIISGTIGVIAATIVPATIVTYQDKTVSTALDELYDSVNLLKTKGDAETTQILTGKKAIVKGQEITGTMANRGTLNWNPSSSTTYTVPAGYYSGGTLNSSGSYNTGYSAGVIAADNRVNPSSVNYQTGYNNGYSSGQTTIKYPIAYIGYASYQEYSSAVYDVMASQALSPYVGTYSNGKTTVSKNCTIRFYLGGNAFDNAGSLIVRKNGSEVGRINIPHKQSVFTYIDVTFNSGDYFDVVVSKNSASGYPTMSFMCVGIMLN